MRKTAINYFDENNTADITILSDYGIDEVEQTAIEQASGIKDLEYSYLKDVTVENTSTSFRIFSIPEKNSFYELKEGTLPQTDTEIAVDYYYKDTYKIGDTITFTEKLSSDDADPVLKNHDFTIVGYVYSSDILSGINRGQTTVGTGELDSYAVVKKEVFNSDVYMMAKLTFTDTEGVNPYSDEYTNLIQKHKEELENLLDGQKDTRLASIKAEYQSQIDDAQAEVNDGKQELEDNRNKLSNAETQIANAENQIEESENTLKSTKTKITKVENQISSSEQTLASKQAEYDSGLETYNQSLAEYNTNLEAFNTSKAQLETAKAQIANSGAPQEIISQKLAELTSLETQISQSETALNSAKSQLDSAKSELDSAKSQLENGYNQLKSAKTQLASSKAEYNSGLQQLNEAKAELESKKQEYADAKAEFDEKEPEANQKIADAEAKIADAQKTLDDLDLPTYSVDTRREIPGSEGYKTYGTVAQIIDSLAKIFPVFLYFVAALVTFTTMTRFVNEERINSGTLKALGYEDRDIIKKFTIYGFIAGTFGTILGVTLGHTLLPEIVYTACKSGFTVPEIELHFYPGITICAIILSLCSSVLPAFIASKRGLQETPASLLLPKAPRAGTKILLEKITPIWNKMSFTHKVTARNIFRYKSRMFMTIFGIAGATAILFTGFSVQGSISEINQRQFGELIKYDIIQVSNNNLSDNESAELNNLLTSDEVKSFSPIYYESAYIKAGKNNDKEDIRVIVPENTESFKDYINLVNRKTDEHLDLTDNGAIVSERLADVYNLKVGDYLEFTDSKDNKRAVKIDGICEMYTGHFIFMNSTVYERTYNSTFETNSNLILLNDGSLDNTEKVASEFMKLTATKGIVSNVTMENQIQTIVNALDMIMKVLILVSGMLAIVIIYNLTNINVTERIRELCTIKVLGFRDKEVTMYIYRETAVLTILAIIVGWLIGIGLHAYILEIVPPDEVMFNPAIVITAFAVPFVVITIISLILKVYVNNKLKNVDMLDALKSVD